MKKAITLYILHFWTTETPTGQKPICSFFNNHHTGHNFVTIYLFGGAMAQTYIK